MNKRVVSLFTALILSCFAWATQVLSEVNLPSSNKPVLLYSNQLQNDLQLTFTSAIVEAKQSVHLLIYSLTDPKIIQALNEKSEQGLEVKVVCDAKASRDIEKKLGNKVRLVKRYGEGLMHLKILVIDGLQTWLGSANLTGDSLKMHGNLVMAMHHPTIAETVMQKLESLGEYERSEKIAHQEFLLAGQKVELWFLPDDRKAVQRIKQLIQSAKKTIRVAMFTWTRLDFAEEILDAAKQGVDVEIVTDRNQSAGTNAKIVSLLSQGKIFLKVNKGPGLLHHKFLYLDGKTLVNGSANWTQAAFKQNDDCFIIMHDLTEEQRKQMDDLWKVIKLDSVSPV